MISTPCVDQPHDPIEQDIPDFNPSCAVTRAMMKKANQNHGTQDIDLIDSSIGQSFSDEISKIVNEYDQEIPQSQTADNPVAP